MGENSIKIGDRIQCEFPTDSRGYYIRDEGEFGDVMMDDGSSMSIKKKFIHAVNEETPNPIRRLCEALELSKRCEKFCIRDNNRLEDENQMLSAEIDVCEEMVMDVLAGRQVMDEFVVPGEKKAWPIPLNGKNMDPCNIWDRSMLRGAIRRKAEKLINIRSIEEYEKEMMEEREDEKEEEGDAKE